MRHRATLGLAILLAAIAIGGQRAHAGFQVCNDANLQINVAIGYVDQQQKWIGQGWWPIDPGKCQEILNGDLTNRYYYFYATGNDGGKTRRWSGEVPFCIQPEPFTLDQAQYGKNTEEDCAKAGLRFAKFRKVDVHGQKNHTHRLKLQEAPASNQPVAGAGSDPSPQRQPQFQPPAPQFQAPAAQAQPPAPPPQRPVAGGGNMQQRPYQQAPAQAPQPAPPQAAPGGGGGGAACQRYPNLC